MTKTEFCRRNQISTEKNQFFSNSKSSTYEKNWKKIGKKFGQFKKWLYLCITKTKIKTIYYEDN